VEFVDEEKNIVFLGSCRLCSLFTVHSWAHKPQRQQRGGLNCGERGREKRVVTVVLKPVASLLWMAFCVRHSTNILVQVEPLFRNTVCLWSIFSMGGRRYSMWVVDSAWAWLPHYPRIILEKKSHQSWQPTAKGLLSHSAIINRLNRSRKLTNILLTTLNLTNWKKMEAESICLKRQSQEIFDLYFFS
jgi:hypothetical protein